MDQDLKSIVNNWHIKANNDLTTIEDILHSETGIPPKI